MTDMPETIWATKDEDDVSAQILGDLYAQHFREGMTGEPVAYRRADLPPSREQVEAMVKPLEWKNFDAWTWWATTKEVTYRVNEREGQWVASFGYGPSEIYGIVDAKDNSEAACKAACEQHRTRRILAALGYEVSND